MSVGEKYVAQGEERIEFYEEVLKRANEVSLQPSASH